MQSDWELADAVPARVASDAAEQHVSASRSLENFTRRGILSRERYTWSRWLQNQTGAKMAAAAIATTAIIATVMTVLPSRL